MQIGREAVDGLVEIRVKAKLGERRREVIDRHIELHSKHDAEEGGGEEVVDWHVERVAET